MSTRVKAAIAVTFLVLVVGFYGYAAWKTAPILAPQIAAYNQAHPLNWVDVGLGALLTFVTMMTVFISLTLRETKRFEGEMGDGGGTGGSGGGARRVRMPMSAKVIDIRSWQPPPNTPMHRGFAVS